MRAVMQATGIMAKAATVFAPAPAKDVRLFLCPYGRYANKEVQTCETGGILTFQDTWRKTQFRLVRRTKVAVNSSVFSFLLRAVYGETMTYGRWMERWRAVAASEGWGKDAFDTDSVLLLELEKTE